jgi:hypothetical protein
LHPVSKITLEKYKLELEIISKTALQIQKDFQLFDLNIEFSGDANTAYTELHQQILPSIERLLNLDSARFFALLYAIDVDENQLKKILFHNEKAEPATEITALILEREFLKVVTRKLLSQGNN